jgi:hypothetical protein
VSERKSFFPDTAEKWATLLTILALASGLLYDHWVKPTGDLASFRSEIKGKFELLQEKVQSLNCIVLDLKDDVKYLIRANKQLRAQKGLMTYDD